MIQIFSCCCCQKSLNCLSQAIKSPLLSPSAQISWGLLWMLRLQRFTSAVFSETGLQLDVPWARQRERSQYFSVHVSTECRSTCRDLIEMRITSQRAPCILTALRAVVAWVCRLHRELLLIYSNACEKVGKRSVLNVCKNSTVGKAPHQFGVVKLKPFYAVKSFMGPKKYSFSLQHQFILSQILSLMTSEMYINIYLGCISLWLEALGFQSIKLSRKLSYPSLVWCTGKW